MAEVAYERDELELAAELVNEGLPLCRELSFAEFVSQGLSLLARIRQAQGDPAGARRAMEMAENHSDPVIADLLNPVPAQWARLLLVQGETAAAASGWPDGASAPMTNRPMRENPRISCWSVSCLFRSVLLKRSGSWTGCALWRQHNAAMGA